MARVVIEGLTKVFSAPGGEQSPAVNEISLAIEDGELLAVVGPSGGGKTTLLRLIAGLEEPTRGDISIGGRSMRGVEPKDRDVAMVFQNQALYPHLNARQNLELGLILRRIPAAEIEQRVKAVSKTLGLDGCLQRRPAELSGGERQRVALGRAMARQPALFLFDEPLSQLDATLRARLRLEFARLHRLLRATMIYVTHDQLEAMALGDRLAVINAGSLQQVGKPLEIYNRPANRFVAEFIGSPSMNFLSGSLVEEGGRVCFCAPPPEAGSLPLSLPIPQSLAAGLRGQERKPLTLGIRPEHVRSTMTDLPAFSSTALDATVELVETRGAETFLHLACAGHPLIMRAPETSSRGAAQTIPIALDLAHVHFFDTATGTALRPGGC